MKYLAILAIALFAVVAAEPEADAEAAAHYGGYYGYRPYGYNYGYYGYPYHGRYYGYGHRFYKREAEAEADAAPALYGGYYRPYAFGAFNAYSPYYYGYPYATAASHQQVHTPAASYGISQLHKRSADAEPEAEAFYGAYYSPYAFAHAYQPYYYALPAASSHQEVHTPAASYGISQIHKRSADAEPEAEALYGAYYGYGLGVARYPGYATSFEHRSPQGARGYYGYPYGLWY